MEHSKTRAMGSRGAWAHQNRARLARPAAPAPNWCRGSHHCRARAPRRGIGGAGRPGKKRAMLHCGAYWAWAKSMPGLLHRFGASARFVPQIGALARFLAHHYGAEHWFGAGRGRGRGGVLHHFGARTRHPEFFGGYFEGTS
jgi:hypothetical protein